MSVKNYNKLDISKNLSKKKGFSLLFSKKIVDELIDVIKESLIDKNINLKNLGNFKLIQKKERIGRNPKTMEKFKILPRKSISFIAAKKRREMKQVLGLLVENSNLITSHMVEKALMAGRIDGAKEALTKISEDLIKQTQNRSVEKIFEELNCSVKVICGEKDFIVPVAQFDCEIIKGVGHMPHLEAPAEVNKIIEEHIKENC